MPLIADDTPFSAGPVGTLPESEPHFPAPAPSFWSQTVPAAFRMENTVGSAVARTPGAPGALDRSAINPGFDPFKDIAGYETNADSFAYANSDAEVAALKRQIDREREDRLMLERSGWRGVGAMLMAGVLDPVNFIPVGGTAYKTYRGGGHILNGAATTAKAGLLSSTAAEALMHQTQETRTATDSALNITAATFLGGLLGAGTGKVRALVESRAIARGVELAKAKPEAGGLGDTIDIRLGDLEAELKRVLVTQGRGERTGLSPDDLGVRSIAGKPIGNVPKGEIDLHFNSGLVKIVWRHGSKSLEKPINQVTDADLIAMPSLFRERQPNVVADDKGGATWIWDIDRDAGLGLRRVRYAVKRLDRGGGNRHLVTVHIDETANPGPTSPKRHLRNRIFGTDKEKAPDAPASSPMDRSKGEIPPGGSPIPTPRGRAHEAPSDGNIARGPGEIDPFSAQASAWDDLVARIDDDLTVRPDDAPDPIEPGQVRMTEDDLEAATGGDSSVGAAQVRTGEEKIKSALGMEFVLKEASPLMRAVMSKSVETRRAVQDLVETPFFYEKNAHGIATEIPAEAMIRRWQWNLAEGVQGIDTAFVKYRKGRSVATVTAGDLLPGSPVREGQALSYEAFRDEVGRAMRSADRHQIPEVAEAAKHLRETVFEPLKDEAIKRGLLPEDVSVDTALSYFTRVYDHEKITARRPDFIDTVTDWLRSERDGAAERIDGWNAELDDLRGKLPAMEQDRALAETEHAAARSEWKSARVGLAAAERDVMAAKREARVAEVELNRVLGREREFTPTPSLAADDPLAAALKDMRRGLAHPKVQRLASFLVWKGGIRESGGELAHMGLTAKARPGLINNKAGIHLDDAALMAWEYGFFPGHAERPDINELLEALRTDISGTPVVRTEDLDALAYADYLAELERSIDDVGLDPRTATPAEIDIAFQQVSNPGTGHRSGPKYRASTPAARAKAREIAFYRRRAETRAEQARQRLSEADARRAGFLEARDKARADTADLAGMRAMADRQARGAARRAEKLRALIDGERQFAGAEDIELKDIADQITDHVTGAPAGRIPYEAVPLARGPLKERTFNIPDRLIEDFLQNDAELVAKRYVHTLAPDVELAAKFGRADLEDQIAKINDDYNRKMDSPDISETARRKLDKAKRADIRDISAMRDRLRGTYRAPSDPNSALVRTGRVLRDWNYLRHLGGMTITALTDVARPMMAHGLTRTLGSGFRPLVSNLRALKLAGREAKMAGTALDMVLDSRAMSLADIGDDFGRNTKFERGVRGLADRFGVASLMSPWNAAMKQWVGAMSGTRILEEAAGWTAGRIAKVNREYLAMLGVDADTARRIAVQAGEFGEKTDGVWVARTDRWTDAEAVRIFRAALAKDVDRLIVTPGAGDRPLWMSWELGKLVGQYKSFSVAASQRVLLSSLQQRDLATLNGATVMVGLGAGVYAIKSWQAGKEASDDPAVWIAEGIDRSGITGWFFDVNNVAEKTLGVGVGRALGGPQMSRYANRNALGAILGPSAGTVQDIAKVGQSALSGDWRKSDARAVRRLLPYQNLFYLRGLFDRAEAGLNENLGVNR